jgi:ketol-acid reductoisomerase
MSSKDGALRVGVVGCGSFGRNHARVYRDLQKDAAQDVEFVGIADADYARARAVAKEFGTQSFHSPEELIAAGVQAVSVAVPTVSHLAVAGKLMENGVRPTDRRRQSKWPRSAGRSSGALQSRGTGDGSVAEAAHVF